MPRRLSPAQKHALGEERRGHNVKCIEVDTETTFKDSFRMNNTPYVVSRLLNHWTFGLIYLCLFETFNIMKPTFSVNGLSQF